MITGYITHEEATIRSYMKDPEFAEYMLQEAIKDGDMIEVRKIQRRINEAKSRMEATKVSEQLMPELQGAMA